jgi:hypothetical protein
MELHFNKEESLNRSGYVKLNYDPDDIDEILFRKY